MAIQALHTIAGLHPASGGPARTVTSLVKNLDSHTGISVTLVTQKLKGDDVYFGSLQRDKVEIASTSSVWSLKVGLPLHARLSKLISLRHPTILHDHGAWLPSNHIVTRLARTNNLIRVVHPRGMLEPWAMSFKPYKKKLAWLAYQREDLASAALLFATAESEADSFRNLGCKQPIAVIPNGVDQLDNAPLDPSKRAAERTRNVVFMSRIHPKKGLIGLIDAWAKLRPTGWRLVLAGPDEGGHLREVMARARSSGLEEAVDYRGAVEGDAKAELLKSADLFILPSFSENFGVVVAEALGSGVSVIATLGTPWEGLVDNGCGWWVAPEPDALADALSQAMTLSDDERYSMGIRGQQYARQFDWRHIADETANVYRWLLHQADLPDCVRLD